MVSLLARLGGSPTYFPPVTMATLPVRSATSVVGSNLKVMAVADEENLMMARPHGARSALSLLERRRFPIFSM